MYFGVRWLGSFLKWPESGYPPDYRAERNPLSMLACRSWALVESTYLKEKKMDEPFKDVVKYHVEDHIFVLNLSGNIDEHKLDESVRLLQSIHESNLGNDSTIKLLIDFRETLWDSVKTHFRTRQVLGKHLQKIRERHYFFALLNNENFWQTSDNEAHFTEEREAWTWLESKQ